MTFELIQTGVIQGLVLAMIALGIMVPFRLLNFPDLTAEGAYPLGGAMCASFLNMGVTPIIAVIMSALGAGIFAVGTAQVAIRMKVNTLLAGIILSTMAYSINLRMMGKPNVALFDKVMIHFNVFSLVAILVVCLISFLLFLKTDFGLRFRAVGLNPKFAERKKVSINLYTSLGLLIAGLLFGLAGSIMVQIQQFMDIGMGVGIAIHGLASLILGEAIVGNDTLKKQLVAPIVGALVYQQIQGIALSFGLSSSDLKFFTGFIILLVLGLKMGEKK